MGNSILLNVLADEVEAINTPAPLDGLLRGLSAESKEPLATKSETTELKRMQGQFESLEKQLATYGDDRTKPEWLRRRSELIASGKADEAVILDRDGVRREFVARRQALKAGLLEISALARPICRAILQRVADRAAGVADKIEETERATAARFGARHATSPAVRGLRRLRELADHLCSGGMASPKSMLSGVIEI